MRAHVHPLFDDPQQAWGPPVTPERVARTEAALGFRLPPALVADLTACNGGLLRRTLLVGGPRPLRLRDLAGLGYPEGLAQSARLSAEWDYPTPSLVLSSEGPTAVLLDYRRCGPHGEPSVVFVDTDHEVAGRPAEWTLAASYADFRARLHFRHSRTRIAVTGVSFHEDLLEAAGALGATGAVRPDHEGGHTRALDGWRTDAPGPCLVRVLPSRRPNGSRRVAELGDGVFVVETNVARVPAFLEAFSAHMPGEHLWLTAPVSEG